ncbi:ATPase assembly factor ATP10, mitochondria [Ascosphaera apis ARSEF 7405]|uniref:ATPase assembly factor ATP10, mitochondria n=1 Tax=Ascosphaera apis ARSEF 7405 TaxID=392613 RepID=A0A167XF90_9EURO|nr:ATPase assembly factor ATP10, mitochondria [Ascosphaera apis ARSEF 7405]
MSQSVLLRSFALYSPHRITCHSVPNGCTSLVVPVIRSRSVRHKSSSPTAPSSPPPPPPPSDQLTPPPLRPGARPTLIVPPAAAQKEPSGSGGAIEIENENTGIDKRSLKQRRADLVDKEKNLERRGELLKELNRGYFNEWRDMKYHQGKTWIGPPRIFKGDRAGYMPNLYGRTIAKGRDGKGRATTDAMKGKVSIVSVYSSAWAQRQAETFTGLKANKELHDLIQRSGGRAQQVIVNVSLSWIKSLLLRLFTWRLRSQVPKDVHSQYFLVRKGFTRALAGQMGMNNLSVGHTYLVDGECRIRWAGNGEAWEGERESLNRGVVRLLEQEQKKTTTR